MQHIAQLVNNIVIIPFIKIDGYVISRSIRNLIGSVVML